MKLTNRRSPAANTHKTTKSLHFIRLVLVDSSAKTKQNIERCTCSPLFRYHFQFFDLSNTSYQNHFHKIFPSLIHTFPPLKVQKRQKKFKFIPHAFMHPKITQQCRAMRNSLFLISRPSNLERKIDLKLPFSAPLHTIPVLGIVSLQFSFSPFPK